MLAIALSAVALALSLVPSPHYSAIQSAASSLADTNNKSVTSDDATEPTPDKDGAYRIGGTVKPPKLIYSIEPKIAKKDRKNTRWGKTTTLIQLTIDTEGHVKNVHVIKSSLETMKSKDTEAAAIVDQSCLDAVSQYRFEPATLNAKAVPVLINVQVQVRIY